MSTTKNLPPTRSKHTLALHRRQEAARARSMAAHPSARATSLAATYPDDRQSSEAGRLDSHEGSLLTEYGLLAVVAATVAGVIIQWASGGALVTLFNALLRQARDLVGA